MMGNLFHLKLVGELFQSSDLSTYIINNEHANIEEFDKNKNKIIFLFSVINSSQDMIQNETRYLTRR